MEGRGVGREIERKFLVKNRNWQNNASGLSIRQGYLSTDPERVIRVRITADQANITIKSRISRLTRREFEYPIPVRDAEELLTHVCIGYRIFKIRYRIQHENHIWEIDCFQDENNGLVTAEIELTSEDELFSIPPWLGEEVTDDPKYLNINLSQFPYSRWGSPPTPGQP